MDAHDVNVLLSLVKPGGSRWSVEMAIVTRLAQLRGGGWLWAAQAAEWTGADPVVCRRALHSLEARKIIKRDPGDDASAKIRWCAVNDEWRRWRVEWVIDASQVAAQLALAQRQRDESPLTRVFARSLGARSLKRIARSFDARSWEEDLDEVAGIARPGIARSGGAPMSDRALLIARSLGRRRAVLERAIRGDEPQQLTSTGEDADTSSAVVTRVRSEQERVDDVGAEPLRKAIVAAGVTAPGYNRKWLGGPPLRRLLDLVDEHGLESVWEAFKRVPKGELSPVLIVEAMHDVVGMTTEELAPAAPAATEPAAPNIYELAEQRRQEALAQAGSPLPPEEAMAQLAAVRSQWRPGWQDGTESGEGPEAIAR